MKYGLTLEQIELLLKRKENRTKFEMNKDIFNNGSKLITESEGIKIYAHDKTDHTKSLTIVFRPGLSNSDDCWLMWNITEDQRIFMEKIFPMIFRQINEHNSKNKGGENDRIC